MNKYTDAVNSSSFALLLKSLKNVVYQQIIPNEIHLTRE